MSILYFSASFRDNEIRKSFEDQEVSFYDKKSLSRNINNADGSVSIDISALGTIKALLISCDIPITAIINTEDVLIENFVFMTLAGLTSLSISCSDATGAQVDIRIWADTV